MLEGRLLKTLMPL